MSPALAGRFSTTAPPGKPSLGFFKGYIKAKSLLNNKNVIKITGEMKTPEKEVPLTSSWGDLVIQSDKIKIIVMSIEE